MDIGLLFNQVLWGVLVGVSYSLLAMAFSLIFATSGTINFATGEFAMLGAYFCFTALSRLNNNVLLAAVAVVLALLAFGMVLERLAFRRLYRLDPILILIATIGIGSILKNAVLVLWGPYSQSYPQLMPSDPILLGPLVIIPQNLVLLAVGLVAMVAFHLFMTRTRLGTAMRATAQNIRGASLVGIDTARCVNLSWALGSLMAGLGGVLIAFAYNISIDMGGSLAIKGFTGAILGGFGNLPASMAGGVLLGIAENLSAQVVSYYYRDVLAFLVIVVILLFKPTGLFVQQKKFRRL
jgi:branched-chain amino acid transport system permease protein